MPEHKNGMIFHWAIYQKAHLLQKRREQRRAKRRRDNPLVIGQSHGDVESDIMTLECPNAGEERLLDGACEKESERMAET